MTKREIAKNVFRLNWSEIQSDNPAYGYELEFMQDELEKLEKEEIIKILFAVLEATNLNHAYPEEFKTLLEFKYL